MVRLFLYKVFRAISYLIIGLAEDLRGRLSPNPILIGPENELPEQYDGLSLVCVPAEVYSEYSTLFRKTLGPNVLLLGCCNGMIGYLQTSQAEQEGGYDGKEFYNQI